MSGEPFAEIVVQVQGLAVRCLQAGESGPVVVLLHGGGIDSARLSWRLLIPELASVCRIYAPNLPGYGGTPRPAGQELTLEYYTAFVQSLMDALGLPSARLCGISMGGGISLCLALAAPARVERLVLVDSYGLQKRFTAHFLSYLYLRSPWLVRQSWKLAGSRAGARQSLAALLRDPAALTDELIDEVYAAASQPGAGESFYSFQRSELLPNRMRTVLMDRLPELCQPTLVVHGEKDNLVPLDCAREAQRRIPGARLLVIPGAGHWPQRDAPQRFNPPVVQFLSEPA